MRLWRILYSWPVTLVSILLLTMPVYGPFMPYREGELLPVVTKFTVVYSKERGGGLDIQFSYNKARLCELIGVSLREGDSEIQFAPVSGSRGSFTRGLGAQLSRIWHADIPTLEGKQIWFYHRCHVFWLTATKVYG